MSGAAVPRAPMTPILVLRGERGSRRPLPADAPVRGGHEAEPAPGRFRRVPGPQPGVEAEADYLDRVKTFPRMKDEWTSAGRTSEAIAKGAEVIAGRPSEPRGARTGDSRTPRRPPGPLPPLPPPPRGGPLRSRPVLPPARSKLSPYARAYGAPGGGRPRLDT
ncbi:hypothetical protein THAOC_13658, partial [Thalassiosira oceanica]